MVSWCLISGSQPLNDSDQKLVTLAHQAIQCQVRGTPFSPEGKTPPRAVFVTIERFGKIRGCRGDLLPRTRSLEQEVALAARDAAAHDPRYKPMTRAELSDFLVTVTLVDHQDAISNINDLKPEEGLILKSAGHTGVVLPWEGRDPQSRLKWAYQKAGVSQGSSVSLQKLIAQRFRG